MKIQFLSQAEQKKKKPELVKLSFNDMLKKKIITKWHVYWLMEMYSWYVDLGLAPGNLRIREHMKDELSHYSSATFDIDYNFPFGWKEIHGCAHRGDFDLSAHQKLSGKKMTYFDEESKKHIIPHVIEPSMGVGRALLALLYEAYHHNPKDKKRDWIVLKLNPKLCPMQVAVLPLVNKLNDKALQVFDMLKNDFGCMYDKSGAIGRRYARADETGVPICVTIDFDTIEKDNSVTIRDRDSTKQTRVKIEELREKISELF